MLNMKVTESFQDLFNAQASKNPDSIALICGSEKLTYQELNIRADQLAYHLQALKVKPNDLIGVYVERSIDMVIGILGVLKSGGAYVPLDPAYPQERLSYILNHANIQVVVTQSKLINSLPAQIPHVICVGDELPGSTQQPDASLKRVDVAENLAYVIYTSGSTGKPKGVMISQESLGHFIRITCQVLDVTSSDIYLQTASISYALSVRQLMIPLAQGATLVIADSEQMRDPIALFELIKVQRVSLIDMVPSFWRTCTQRLLLLPLAEQRDLLDNQLRRIVSIGEALLSDIPRDWKFKLGHQARLVNIFGQTETTGVVAAYPIPPVEKDEIETVPIGWSMPDTNLYILDTNLHPVSRGKSGELCISNPCLALGYLNRPDLTAQKFIPNPFDDTGQTRLYKTGDIARVRADGAVEFLGRSDSQIKIRGQRLELGEVEAVLSECAAVQSCAVTTQGEHPDDKHLVAYIVTVPGQGLTIPQVRQHMKQRVPEYMVPSIYLFLDALPLTPNGKIDRLTLSDPAFIQINSIQMKMSDMDRTATEVRYVAPENDIERTLISIWQSLLKVNQVGIQDNFFDLGGHSLAAASLLASIEIIFGKRLPVSIFFKGPTIAQLAQAISRANETEIIRKGTESLIPIHIGDKTKAPFFWLHGSDFAYIKPYLDPSQPFYCVMPSGLNEGEAILESEDEIAEHHLRAIQAQQPTGPYLLGGYCNGGKNAIAVALRLIERGHEVRLLALVDVPIPDRKRIEDGEQPIHKRFFDHIKRGRFWDVTYEKLMGRIENITNLLARNTYMLRFNEITQAHDRTFKYYVMPRPFPGEITLFTCQDQHENAKADIDQRWNKLTTQGINQHIIPGNHTTMIRKPNIQILGEKLREAIAEAQTVENIKERHGQLPYMIDL